MKISVLQLDVKAGDRKRNLEAADLAIERAMDAQPDVVVLPELWDVGFYPDNVLELGDIHGEAAREFLGRQALRHGVNIVGGSIARREGQAVWNTCYVVDRQGREIARYDKIHLFSPAGEDGKFAAGNSPVSFSLDGVPASVILCYDLRFGELARLAALDGAAMLFVPAAWPHPRLAHWRLLCQSRAVENQCFLAAANHCGALGNNVFCGSSMIVDPWGEILAQAGEEQGVILAECDLESLAEARQRINVFRDRRPDVYTLNWSPKPS